MLRSTAEVLLRALIMYKNELMKIQQSAQLRDDGDTGSMNIYPTFGDNRFLVFANAYFKQHIYDASKMLITRRESIPWLEPHHPTQ